MKKLVIASLLMLSTPALAAWQRTPLPGVCDSNLNAVDFFKENNYQPWAVSTLIDDHVKPILIIIWRGKGDDIAVTTTRKGSDVTCIVALGNKNTTTLDLDDVPKD